MRFSKRGWKFFGNRQQLTGSKNGADQAKHMRKRVRYLIRGDVQGVGFRWRVRDHARHVGLTGYVQNLPDGRVELVAEGPETTLEDLKAFCYRGPHGAQVSDIEISEASATAAFADFAVRQ
jgi:acylphosphatase